MAILSVYTKSPDYLETIWAPDDGVDAYSVYVSLSDTDGTFQLVKQNIQNATSQEPRFKGKIHTRITLAEVRTSLSNSNLTFDGAYVYYFRITTITSSVETNVDDSDSKEIHPIGIGDQNALDNEVANSQDYFFSKVLQRWIRSAGTKFGALNTFENPLYADNLTVDKTYSAGILQTELWYVTGTPTGGPAKLVTYSYSGSDLIKIVWSDSTAP